MSNQQIPAHVLGEIRRLESELFQSYRRLGIKRTPLPPIRPDNQQDADLHLQWIEKELRWLDRLVTRNRREARERKTLIQRVRRLSPSTLTGRLAQLGLTDPPESVDPFGADARVYERLRPLIRRLFEEYWRVEVDGIQNIPSDGAGLLVANHGGLLPFDALMIRYAVQEMHPAGRVPRFLIEDWFMRLAGVGLLLQRLGALRGSQDNARALLDGGFLVGLFPEGAKGVTKRFRDRYKIQRFGRGGTIRLAIRHQVPIVPVAVIGSEEAYPVLMKAQLPRDSEFDFLPITPQFPLLGPLGLAPLPSKWMIRFGEPMDLTDFPAEVADDEITVNTLNEELRQRIQDMVNHLLQRRRSPWLG